MAVVKMQKVAVVAHTSEQEKLVDLLHKEGVMEISDLKSPTNTDHPTLGYRTSELDHVIARLTEFATKDVIAAAEKPATDAQIEAAAQDPEVLRIVQLVHKLDHEHTELKHSLHELEHGRMPTGAPQNQAEEGAYFLSSSVQTDMSSFGGAAAQKEAALQAAVRGAQADVTEKLEGIANILRDLAKHLPLLMHARHFVVWLDEKQALRESLHKTRNTVTIFGWIAKNLFEPLERKLDQMSPATALLRVQPKADESIPVLIKNPIWLKPFESVTTLYGLPQAHEFDPTPLLAPFFILFFGLCLTDAAYGLVLSIIMGVYLWKKKLTVEQAPLWWLLFVGGLATFIISIPFGGWFGLSPDQAPSIMTEMRADGKMWFKGQIWNLGETPGITFFQNLSISLGLLHLSFGMLLAGMAKWLNGNKAEAFWVDWTSLVLFAACGAAIFAPAEYKSIALYSLYGSVVLVVWGKGYGSPIYLRPIYGLLGLLNLAMGMLSNTLSYLRLLALGLVTGALALAVNLVAQQIGGLFPIYIGLPISIVIYIAGHTVNIALNVLGAFIHSGRLQFVEFFGQFFEGGGRPFSAFRRSFSKAV